MKQDGHRVQVQTEPNDPGGGSEGPGDPEPATQAQALDQGGAVWLGELLWTEPALRATRTEAQQGEPRKKPEQNEAVD